MIICVCFVSLLIEHMLFYYCAVLLVYLILQICFEISIELWIGERPLHFPIPPLSFAGVPVHPLKILFD